MRGNVLPHFYIDMPAVTYALYSYTVCETGVQAWTETQTPRKTSLENSTRSERHARLVRSLRGDDRSVKIKSLMAAKIMKIKWLVLGCIEANFVSKYSLESS